MKKPFFNDLNEIVSTIWEPGEKPIALFILAHGITDFHERYEEFGEFLNSHNIAFMGFDYPGHGRSGGTPKVYFGENGTDSLVEILRDHVVFGETLYPDIPIVLVGMSLGSYLVKYYLTEYVEDNHVSGAILIGTGEMESGELLIAKLIVKIEELIHGDKETPKLIQKLAFDGYNRKISNPCTSMDWLIKNPEALNEFINNPLRGEKVTIGAFRDLLNLISETCDIDCISIGRKVPILICSGEEDPVGGFGKRAIDSFINLRIAGYDAICKLYPNSRHDILHDYGSKEAYNDILKWFNDFVRR